MAKGSRPFERATALVEKRSPFDMSHSNYLTMKPGTLTPVLCEKVMPNDTISLGMDFRAQLPPIASNFYGKVKIRFNAFFVPFRLLYGAWKDYLLYGQATGTGFIPEGTQKYYIPALRVSALNYDMFGVGSLADYLGVRHLDGLVAPSVLNLDAMPFLAYHRVWSDWYRQPSIQRDPYLNIISSSSTADVKTLHRAGITSESGVITPTSSSPGTASNSRFADFVNITDLRQVNYDKDYFSTAFRNQSGGSTPMGVSVGFPNNFIAKLALDGFSDAENAVVDSNGYLAGEDTEETYWRFADTSSNPSFTIPQLRTANSLQRFAEQNALAGGRYKDTILANYGITPSDALAEIPVYLGGFEEEIYKNTVLASTSSTSENKGFGDFLGGVGASGFTAATNSLVDKFTFTEHGLFMVLADMIPEGVYSSGIRRQLLHSTNENAVDYLCWPALVNSGNQPIHKLELATDPASVSAFGSTPFGYTDRYAEYKYHPNEVHGNFVLGEDLDFMSIQRDFENPQISDSFLVVNQNSMDNVTAVANALSNYGVMLDIGFSMKMIRPLPVYSIPTLCEEIHKDSVSVSRGGRRF